MVSVDPAGDAGAAGALIRSLSVENLLRQRDAVAERLEQARQLLNEARAIARASGILTDPEYGHRSMQRILAGASSAYLARIPLLDDDTLDAVRRRLDNAAWDLLMQESGLMTFMDAHARQKWRDDVQGGHAPALTLDNIRATFTALYLARGQMLEDGVTRLVKALNWCWRSNRPYLFGRRIVLRVRRHGFVSSEDVAPLEDLNRAFAVLDRQPEDDHRNALYQRLRAAEASDLGRRSRFDLDDRYLRVRVFKNGRAHVYPKRADLVEQVNRMIARRFPNALPPPA